MIENYTFYDYLDAQNKELVDKINNHEILGASNHLNILSDMFINIAEINDDKSVSELIEQINNMKFFFMKTRGSSSRAVVNGIYKLLLNIDQSITTRNDLLEILKNNQNRFIRENEENLQNILKYSKNELSEYSDILLYDYSSTVEKAIITILKDNPEIEYRIYISESSAIDGGSPFLLLNEYNNSKLYFFPDAALSHYVSLSDCCLMGAETFYADGTGFNTIGSDIVSLLCEEYHVPLYFITPMNKLDNRRTSGIKKKEVTTDYRKKYKFSEKIDQSILTIIPELIAVLPKRIYAYITEDGVIPSNQMFLLSKKYLEKLKGSK